MIKPLRRLISAGAFLLLLGALVLAAKKWTEPFFAFYPKISRKILAFLAGLTAPVPVPVWELAVCALAVWLIVSFVLALKRSRFLLWLTGVVEFVCGAAFVFVAIWGLNYFAPPMQERLGFEVEQYTVQELREAAEYYLAQANAAAREVPRGADGVMLEEDFADLAEHAGDGYQALAETMPCFDGSTARVKKLLSSKFMGATGTTGIFIAFTGESSVSSTTFRSSLPFTMCHEIGHRMAFARENEANFAAFLACSVSERADFRYSGYYLAFVYCYNALYRVDRDAASSLWASACGEIKADAAASREHYEKVENEKVSEATYRVYDSYLKAFSVESGKQSYGEVVDLLTAWYYAKIKG